MDALDWNWLFSSVAQSVAALVGVMGAFLISRILNGEMSFARHRSRTRDLLRQGEMLEDRAAARDFEWINQLTLEYGLQDVASAIADTDEVLSPRDYYEKFDFSTYMARDEALEQIEAQIATAVAEKQKPAGPFNFAAWVPTAPEYIVSERQNLTREQDAICDVRLAVRAHMREVREHLDLVCRQPDRSPVMRLTLAALLLLFWLGVIWPLTFLPVGEVAFPVSNALSSARTAMLVIAGTVFTALVISLGFINERLVHSQSELDQLRRELEPARYSIYFQVRADNGLPMDIDEGRDPTNASS